MVARTVPPRGTRLAMTEQLVLVIRPRDTLFCSSQSLHAHSSSCSRQRLVSLVVSVLRTAHQSPLFFLPGLAIECSLLSLSARKAVTAVSLPGQRVIARMLTGWDAAPCLSNLPGFWAFSFTMCPWRGTGAYCFPGQLGKPCPKVLGRVLYFWLVFRNTSSGNGPFRGYAHRLKTSAVVI